jgi:hypothetical protein
VVDVAVCQQDPAYLEALAIDQVEDRLVLQPRIDDDGAPAIPAPQDVAVLGEQRVSKDGQLQPLAQGLGGRHPSSLSPDSG